ncbi:hypothetical protein NKI19_14685 [Mesorhizobium sp. M0751]|uniref:hypothetical protein n=1 Tax=unclassified Mesorhizobium TaxID=325217 RepID=UPI003338D3D0
MRTFAERLVGKSIKSIESGDPGYCISVILSDGAGFAVNTEVTARLPEAHEKLIERVSITEREVTLHVSGDGFVGISIDRERFPKVVEFFVYSDDEGMVVEN